MDSLPQLNGSSRRRTAWSKRERHYPVPTSSSKTFALPRRSPVLRQEQITVVRERAKHRLHSTEILPCSVPRVPLERPGRGHWLASRRSPSSSCRRCATVRCVVRAVLLLKGRDIEHHQRLRISRRSIGVPRGLCGGLVRCSPARRSSRPHAIAATL